MRLWIIEMLAGVILLMGGAANGAVCTVVSGTIELRPAAQYSVFHGDGADIQGGKLVFNYAGVPDPAATIETLMKASWHGGLWDVGQFRSSTAAAVGMTLGCFDNPATRTVTIMPTYSGDFNLDGVVNTADLNIWMANAGTGTTWQKGDVNYDGVANLLDLDLWKANFGKSQPAVNSSVPEPTTIIIWSLLGGLGIAVGWRRRRAA